VTTEPDGFREFVQARSPALLRTAWMLTGDAASAEDLLQTALSRAWPHWPKIATGHPEAYVRTVMVRTNSSWRSRLWRGERPTEDVVIEAHARSSATRDDQAQVDDRVVLAAALATLPVRQRQAVVLRFFDDLSVEAVAEIMGSSTGTVKSQSAKALAKLRSALGANAVLENEER
jgi:RNA polymerase sigma-70 factor (sigma-E family)